MCPYGLDEMLALLRRLLTVTCDISNLLVILPTHSRKPFRGQNVSKTALLLLHGDAGPVFSAMALVIFLIFGREIPSFFILEIRLVRGNPSRAAAPSGPPIIQAVSSSARKIKARVQSLNVLHRELRVVGFRFNPSVESDSGNGLGSTPSFARMTARSIRF